MLAYSYYIDMLLIMKKNIYALMLLLCVFSFMGRPILVVGQQQKEIEKKKITAKERKKMLKEKIAERKRLQKERALLAKQKKKEKLLAQKQKIKEKKEQQKEILRLKKEQGSITRRQNKNLVKESAKIENKNYNEENKLEPSHEKKQSEVAKLDIPNKSEQSPAVDENLIKAQQNSNSKLMQDALQGGAERAAKTESLAQVKSESKIKVKSSGFKDSLRIAKRRSSKIVTLPYDVPTKNMQHESFVKFGKLHKFTVKGLNTKLYDVFVNGDNYTENINFDTSINILYESVKSQPWENKKADLNISLIANEPWLSFFRTDDYRSSVPHSSYRNYIDKFNEIKADLKKEALSYKDFVGVLEVGANNRKLPMQYELLDTTFYKSYYLLFVSRVDLLKDYHNNFVNQVANLDTVRYNEVLRYKQKVQNAINNFVSSKKVIGLAMDSLFNYVRSLDEFYKATFTDPISYEGAELETQKKHFLKTFNLPESLDTAGIAEVISAIRTKILTQKKHIINSFAKVGDAYKSLEAYILQSRDYVDIYHHKYQDIISVLDKMDAFVNKELSLQDRNIRLSEIVENLYRRLMLEYEVMRNQIKDNIVNMDAKVSSYGNFLSNNMSYDRIKDDYQKLRNTLDLYLQDDIYDKLALLVEKIFVNNNDENNFYVDSKVMRIRTTDFVDYNLLVQPKKNLPKQMLPKFTTIRESFRFPVYGGFVHTVSLNLGTNVSFVPQYKLNPVTNDNANDNYTIVQDGSSTKAKFNLGVAYNFLYRTKNSNFRYGGNVGLLLDLTNLLTFERTKVLFGPALQFYDRLLLSAGVTLGAEPRLKSEYRPNQNISIRSNLNGNVNNVIKQIHNNNFAVGIYFSAGITLF